MSVYIKTTEDGRVVEVIGTFVCLDGKKEAHELVPVYAHPNRVAILAVLPEATHMAGRLPLTIEQAAAAQAAIDAAQYAYETSPVGLSERIRNTQRQAIANRD